MNFADPSTALLAACGGDSVKVFDVSEDTGSDPCMLSYSPSPGFQVNSVKWNHTNFFYVHLSPQLQPPTPPAPTMAAAGEGRYLFKESDVRKRKGDFNLNLVIASAGDDKRISLWRKNGQSMGTVPPLGTNAGDNIDESISAISFSNKGSRYLCSGGSGQIVRVWDLQRKRCIKWLRGHTDTITGVMCNCKDEHLASISLKGDLILHNLASGARAAELKDPNEQVLRVLDYSRISRHVLVTAGDNGSVHLWDTTGRSPKVSWLKQHSAPTTGVCFSPSNDKMIASVGLDKKLYTFDSGTRRPTSCVPYEAPFSSLAFRDDGWTLAAGTSSGRVVFYDVRGKPQPYTVLRAYSSSEAITSLCWQRSKPINVNESTCTAETALLGGSEDSILMPDPLPSLTSSSLSSSTAVSTSRNSGRPMSAIDASPLTTTSSGSISTAEVTPQRNHLSTGGGLSRLHPPRSSFNLSDDMEVFSPLVDVQPITPSLSNWWNDQDETKKDNATNEKKSASLVFPSSGRKFPYTEEGNMDSHQISDWKSNPALRQDDTQSTVSQPSAMSSKSEQSFSATPPEAWGGEALSDKLSHHRSALSKPSRFVTTSGSLTSGALMSSSTFVGLQESSASTSHTAISSLTNTSLITNLHGKDISNREALSGLSEPSSTFPFSSIVSSLGTKNSSGQANLDVPGLMSVALPRRYSTYADRISTISSFSDGASYGMGSPKLKKTGAETREELVNSLLARSDTSGAAGMGALPIPNGVTSQPQKGLAQPDQQQGASSFTLQLVQRTLEETLTSVQKSVHEDMRNLHIELLRQFHIQETEMSSVLNSVLEKQAELMKEVQAIRKEHQQLRQLL